MPTPKIGLPGQLVMQGGPGSVTDATVCAVHSSTLVDARPLNGSAVKTSIEFVDIGGTPPAAPANYFQAIDAVN